MWLSETEIEIIEYFSKDIYLELSINELSKKLKKHYRVVRVNVLKLIEKNVLKSKDFLGAKLISLDLNSNFGVSYISYVEEISNQHLTSLPQIKDIIKEANSIDTSYVFGVFNNGEVHQKPFIICNDVKKFESLIKKFSFVNLFTFEDFKNVLSQKNDNNYKKILKTKRIIKGASQFYTMIFGVGKIEN